MGKASRLVLAALGYMLSTAGIASAQVPNWPQTLPPNTVVGRLNIGSGPAQAIPFSALSAYFGLPSSPNNTVLGNISGVSAQPTSLTAAQLTTLCNVFTSSLSGCVAASGGGTSNFLRADGSWVTPSGAGNVSTTDTGSTAGDVVQESGTAGNGVHDSGVAVSNLPTLSGNNTFTGKNVFGAAALFSGEPFVDVKSGTNSCAAAVGNGTNNDYTAINCQVAYMNTTYGGGLVFFPCGTYNLNGNTLSIPGAVILVGAGRGCTTIENNSDVTVINFPDTETGYAGARDISIQGYQSTAATQDAVVIGNNMPVFLYGLNIHGGRYGLNSNGVDGTVQNSYIAGYTGGLLSAGANWYIRVKFDGPWGGGGGGAAYAQTGYFTTGNAENHFIQSDFSGAWTDSVDITDTGGHTITVVQGSVFSSGVSISSGVVMFSANELGSTSFSIASGATASLVGNYAFASTSVSNSGTLKCAGNINISNSGC